jgi:hypothetical protein
MKLGYDADDNRHFVMNVTKETLERAKGFDKNHWPDFGNTQWGDAYDRTFSQPAAR